MASFTIDFNSGGYHGHQIKDFLGAWTIGRLFDLTYIHTPYAYLNHFALDVTNQIYPRWTQRFRFSNIKRISGPYWHGFEDFQKMRSTLGAQILAADKTLYVFDKALRIHPHQTIAWFKEGRISIDLVSEIRSLLTTQYWRRNKLISNRRVAIHISRGADYDREKYPQHFDSDFNVRYMFSLDYFDAIIEQINATYGKGYYEYDIYTEQYNSQAIVDKFTHRQNVHVHVGPNRDHRNNSFVHHIFDKFVSADILVTCNSSFSAVAGYFRAGKQTIYHPHRHLHSMPEPDFIPTDSNGSFDSSMLSSSP